MTKKGREEFIRDAKDKFARDEAERLLRKTPEEIENIDFEDLKKYKEERKKGGEKDGALEEKIRHWEHVFSLASEEAEDDLKKALRAKFEELKDVLYSKKGDKNLPFQIGVWDQEEPPSREEGDDSF